MRDLVLSMEGRNGCGSLGTVAILPLPPGTLSLDHRCI